MSISKEEFKNAADHVGIQGSDRLALWAWWLKAWKCATDFDEAKERELFEAQAPYRIDRHNGVYESQRTQDGWIAWEACAKSRAAR